MNIKVLGTGCASCKALFATVSEVAASISDHITVEKEEELMNIMSYNILSLPALVIDGKVVAKGKMSAKEVTEVINKHLK